LQIFTGDACHAEMEAPLEHDRIIVLTTPTGKLLSHRQVRNWVTVSSSSPTAQSSVLIITSFPPQNHLRKTKP